MSLVSLANFLAIAVYLATGLYLLFAYSHQQPPATRWVVVGTVIGLLLHGYSIEAEVFVEGGINATLYKLPTFVFWVMNLIVLVSGFKKPLYNLFVFLFPLTILAILVAEFSQDELIAASPAIGHIALALLASGFLTIATLQALVLAFQNYQLKHKHATGIVRLLPPLQTMESLMFQLLWIGQLFLTLLILSGFFILSDIVAQQQTHTLAFSLLAWAIYATLLWGRHQLGWRGNTAIRWTLGGYAALLLAYVGTQLVYQVILT